MITRSQFFAKLEEIADTMESVGTVYDWKKPINLKNCLKQSTCIGYVASAMQETNLLPKNKYVHMLTNGTLSGNGIDYIKSHPEKFSMHRVNKTPKALGDNLKRGDICLYTTPHIQVFYGYNSDGVPLWYSLEHKSGHRKVVLTVRQKFSFYSNRKINYIIRPKFKAEDESNKEPKPKKKTHPKYKFKQSMNLRERPTVNSDAIGKVEKGKVKTAWDKDGTWIKVKEDGKWGWVNASTKYAERL